MQKYTITEVTELIANLQSGKLEALDISDESVKDKKK